MFEELARNPAFGITLTLLAYYIGVVVNNRVKSHLANPILLGCILIITLLLCCKTPFNSYNKGAQYISFLLGPATVALAVPLYRNFTLINNNRLAILCGIFLGSLTGVVSASLIAIALGANRVIAVSMAPKSVTSPIAMEISRILGGYPSLTASVVIITGIIGAMIGPEILKWTGVKNKLARGLAMGTAAHGIGTIRALQEGDVEGAMSGLAIGLAGIITSLITPAIMYLIH